MNKQRYPGPRWEIVMGQYRGIEEFAVNELQRLIQQYPPYVIGVQSAALVRPDIDAHLVLVGTPASNRWIRELVRRKQISIPAHPEGYLLARVEGYWRPDRRLLVVAGHDAKGVLNGVVDFGAKILGQYALPPGEQDRPKALEGIPLFSRSGHPAIENRGIWSWGYVIYDYRRFLDNMARLKLNMLVMWNDCPPHNFRQIVDSAHDRGIRVIAGFHWGWGKVGLALNSRRDRAKVKAEVIRNYETNYRDTKVDGIYFQTLTEHEETTCGDRSVAALVCDWVNEIGRALLKINPRLYIQFGLHATSITKYYQDLAELDSRIAIIWEDAGVTPYAYSPTLTVAADDLVARQWIGAAEGTLAYSLKLAKFRGRCEFGLCAKGFSAINFRDDFEHHGPFILGERSSTFIRRRSAQRQEYWDSINSRWIKCLPAAARFYREVRKAAHGPMTVVALVENGLFEQAIPAAVALFAETVWNPQTDEASLLETALAPYYRNY
ncbi:MAG: hypothetical protein PHW60_03855 [Kiritimatiellae bacterium]|nr:hypothetical protein [Kiritimatiellia bacterium]